MCIPGVLPKTSHLNVFLHCDDTESIKGWLLYGKYHSWSHISYITTKEDIYLGHPVYKSVLWKGWYRWTETAWELSSRVSEEGTNGLVEICSTPPTSPLLSLGMRIPVSVLLGWPIYQGCPWEGPLKQFYPLYASHCLCAECYVALTIQGVSELWITQEPISRIHKESEYGRATQNGCKWGCCLKNNCCG